jgi:uncharacterized membrane protein YdbT with pleckstrin-like domain
MEADDEETRVAVRAAESSTTDEPENRRHSSVQVDLPIFTIGPTLMFVKIGYVLAAVAALLLVALLSIFDVSRWESVLIGLLLFLIPAFYHLKAKLVSYSLTGSQIEVDSGLIARTTRSVPLRRIQDVTVATSAMQRLLGFGDLVIDNASEAGGKVVLKNINSPKTYAEMMLREMHNLDK